MIRTETHSDDFIISQKPTISDDPNEYGGDIVTAQQVIDKDYAAELAFNEEPLTIRLQPSSEKNAAMSMPVTVNGKPAEVYQNGRWMEVGYLPVNTTLTVKRKVVEIIARARIDTVNTEIIGPETADPRNQIRRNTSPLHSFSILEDKNPRGRAWLTELMNRNF